MRGTRDDDQAPDGAVDDRHVVDDAYWDVRAVDYVDTSAPLSQDLGEDSDRLTHTWEMAIATLRAQLDEPADVRQRIEEQAAGLIARLEPEPEPEVTDDLDAKADRRATPVRRRAGRALGRLLRTAT